MADINTGPQPIAVSGNTAGIPLSQIDRTAVAVPTGTPQTPVPPAAIPAGAVDRSAGAAPTPYQSGVTQSRATVTVAATTVTPTSAGSVIPAPAGALPISVADDGSTLTTAVRSFNFVGDGVVAVANTQNNAVTVTITGGNVISNYSNANVAAYLPTNTSNVSGNYFIGNGSLLTGIVAVSSYANANVAAYLPTYTGNLVSLTGNVTTTANISGSYILGNGSQLTGLAATYSNTNVVSLLSSFGSNTVSTTGNITGGNLITSGIVSFTGGKMTMRTGNSSGSIQGSANTAIIVSSQESTGSSSLQWVNDGVAPTALSAVWVNPGGGMPGDVVILTGTYNPSTGTLDKTWTFGANGNLTAPGNVSTTGNITGNFFIGNGSQLTGITANTGNVTFSSEIVIGTGTSNLISGLYLAPSSSSANANMYLRVRGNVIDEPTHIHFDTGNNQYYNQFIGDDYKYVQLANTGNIVINTNNYVGNSAQWNFDYNGVLTLPNADASGFGNIYFEENSSTITFGLDDNTTPFLYSFSTSGITLPRGGATIRDTVGNAVAFGRDAAATGPQGNAAVAIGQQAGETSQGLNAVAVGALAGTNTQNANAVAIGRQAGSSTQGTSAVAVGVLAGNSIQGDSAVAIGQSAGSTSQGNAAVAVGAVAGDANQGIQAVAIGLYAGYNTQGAYSVAIGASSGQTSQGQESVAVGVQAGVTGQGNIAVAVGSSAGYTGQGAAAVAVGQSAGAYTQGIQAVAVGYLAGNATQGIYSVAVGSGAGKTTQGLQAVAIGLQAGFASQGNFAVAIGKFAANTSQGTYAVAVGPNAGFENQLANAVAIGSQAGSSSQGTDSVAVGTNAAYNTQGSNAVAVGNSAAYLVQGTNSVAIGVNAGLLFLGNSSIAIGANAGNNQQGNNSIIFNATGSNLRNTTANTFTVAPVRNDIANTANVMFYNATSNEITYGNTISVAGNVTGNYILGNGSQLTSINAVTVDITDTNGLTTVYYPTFVENRTTAQIARADVDLTYRTDDNLLTVGNVSVTGNVTGGNLITGGLVSATGNITATGNISGGNLSITGNTATITSANYQIGYLEIPQISLSANATTALTDSGKHFYSVSASNLQLTIANNTSVAWTVGTALTIVNRGTANVLIVPGTGVSLYLAGNSTSANRVVTTYGMATMINVAANIWMINGTVV